MNDQQRVQGEWELVSGARHGKAFPEEVVKRVTLVFEKDALTTKNGDRSSVARFTLKPDTTPKGIDLDMEGSVGEGIYALEGDELRILHGEVGEARPKGFDGEGAERLTLLVLRRKGGLE
jgi:uncharacterized protein (TIGR03067 family)